MQNINKINLFKINFYEQYIHKEFNFVLDNIYKILQKKCIEELKMIIEYGKFIEIDDYDWTGSGWGYNYLIIYENSDGIKFTCNTHLEDNIYIFYIITDKKFINNTEYMNIINNIKKNLYKLCGNKLLELTSS